MIAVVVLTHNRVHLLRQCVENVLLRTSSSTCEIVLWNNASVDGTREYLDSLPDPRIRVVHHTENIGQNAYARAFRLTSSEYMIEMDDDVIDAPNGWDETLLEAFRRLPEIGYLAANLVDDPNDSASQYMRYLRETKNAYTLKEINGLRILEGPTGGGCTMTSRSPWITSVGAVIWRSSAVRSPDLKIAASWRAGPSAFLPPSRSQASSATARTRSTSRGKPWEPM